MQTRTPGEITLQKIAHKGQNHHKAKLTDLEVERMRELHAEFAVGHPNHLGYRRLAKLFEVPRATVQRLVTGRDRL